ncbi:MAG: S53 family peptidase [Acidobacteriaceae bacterium]
MARRTISMVAIPGSKKAPFRAARIVSPAAATERFEVTVRLRPRLAPAVKSITRAKARSTVLTHEQYDALYGADPKDIKLVAKFAKRHNLVVVRESSPRRSVMLSGQVADFEKAFGVKLFLYEHSQGTYRGRTGSIHIPSELAPVIQAVLGLDNRPVAWPHFRANPRSSRPADGARAFYPNEVARLYKYPQDVTGAGQCIGILELGGGYRPQDLRSYFKNLDIPLPTVVPVSVDGAMNAPFGTSNGADGEVALDIEVAATIAPGAKLAVYFGPNDRTGKGFLDTLTAAVHDTVHNPSVISISWGGPETLVKSEVGFQLQFNQELAAAAKLGITVCTSVGDNGAADAGPLGWSGKAQVDFPAASPYVLSCGGTRLLSTKGVTQSESVWNQHYADTSPEALAEDPEGSFGATGGGVSGAFPRPKYQRHAKISPSLNPAGFLGRGVPDVAGCGDPATGYHVLVNGVPDQYGGTSAVAPLWAGFIALLNQKLGRRVGFVNRKLYVLARNHKVFRDVTSGDNRVSYKSFNNVGYPAGPGWDPCTGLGSPDGAKLATLLAAWFSAAKKTPAVKREKPSSKSPHKSRSTKRSNRKDQNHKAVKRT